MNQVKNKIRKIKFWLAHDFFTIENIILVVAIILCFSWTFRSIEAMSRSWEISEKLAKERKALELLEIEVSAAELENEYYRSEEYQELVARKQLDKKLDGENMVVLAPNSENAKNKYKEFVVESSTRNYSNLEKWALYLFPSY